MTCPRCTGCEGQYHHWLAEIDHADPPLYTHGCKHCDAIGMTCDECDEAGMIEGTAGTVTCLPCHGEGVVVLGLLSEDWRETRHLLAQWLWFAQSALPQRGFYLDTPPTIATDEGERLRQLVAETRRTLAVFPKERSPS
jgi:hypothetical protein